MKYRVTSYVYGGGEDIIEADSVNVTESGALVFKRLVNSNTVSLEYVVAAYNAEEWVHFEVVEE